MILVGNDDLSGAAELAGIAFAHGLTAEVQTGYSRAPGAGDLSGHDAATAGTGGTAAGLWKLARKRRLRQIHFKTDSAWGEHWGGLGVLLEITARVRAVFVPAIRPAAGRFARVNIGSAMPC